MKGISDDEYENIIKFMDSNYLQYSINKGG